MEMISLPINASLYQEMSSDPKGVKKDGLQPCDFVSVLFRLADDVKSEWKHET